MHTQPDYTTLRDPRQFACYASACYLAYQTMAGVALEEFYQRPGACIEAYRVGRSRVRELFGPEVHIGAPATPPISYGHPNGLGAQLYFPAGGEVAVEHCCRGPLADAIALLRRPVDYARAGRFPFFADFQAQMQAAFPGEAIGLSWGLEGPLTTAYELRGDQWFLDPYDEPALAREFLRLLTGSILDFHAWRAHADGRLLLSPDGAGLCDDVAAMMPPRLWPEFVLPYWELYFSGVTTGRRSAHVEDLRPAHLPFLEAIGLWSFDPSISARLNPRLIRDHCRVPFGWRVGSFHYRALSEADVADLVFQAAADGAGSVFTVVEGSMCDAATAAKVRALLAAGKEVQRQLAAGATRAELATCVSPAGRQRFWDHWPA